MTVRASGVAHHDSIGNLTPANVYFGFDRKGKGSNAAMDAIPVCDTTEVQWVLAELMVSLTGACGFALPARLCMETVD